MAGSRSYTRPGEPNPVGQTIVKEAWVPEEVKEDDRSQETANIPHARKDGRLYRASRKAALFIMFKLDPSTPGTDQGWVYGTVTPDGKQVTSVGRVASCMHCHERAPHDRLFGLPNSKKEE
jgi:Cytochrome P460